MNTLLVTVAICLVMTQAVLRWVENDRYSVREQNPLVVGVFGEWPALWQYLVSRLPVVVVCILLASADVTGGNALIASWVGYLAVLQIKDNF